MGQTSGSGAASDGRRASDGSDSSSLAEALAALRAARAAEVRETRSTAERFEAAARALREAIRANPMDVRIREALAELSSHESEHPKEESDGR